MKYILRIPAVLTACDNPHLNIFKIFAVIVPSDTHLSLRVGAEVRFTLATIACTAVLIRQWLNGLSHEGVTGSELYWH